MRKVIHHFLLPIILVSVFSSHTAFAPSRDKLTPEKLIKLGETSATYGEFVSQLTQRYPPLGKAYFWSSDRGVQATTAKTPQGFIMVDNATIALAPDQFCEAVFNFGESTVIIHVVSDENGKPAINRFKFTPRAVVKTEVEHHISTMLAKQIGTRGLADKSKPYEIESCVHCHLEVRRRLFEADNHHRIFDPDKDWVFRDPKQRAQVEKRLKDKVKAFDTPENHANPVYAWMFNQPDVKRRGYLTGTDLVSAGRVYRQMARDQANEQLGELKKHKEWPLLKTAFQYAVTGDPRFEAEVARVAKEHPELLQSKMPGGGALAPDHLKDELARIEALQAQRTLAHIKLRNARSMAYILSDGDKDRFQNLLRDESMLLLNQGSIENIGPEILNHLVTDEQWEKLSLSEKARSVRLRDLDVRNLRELKKLVSSPENLSHIKKRADTHLILKLLLGSDRAALTHLSMSIGATAEARGRGSDLIENYARALERFGSGQHTFTTDPDPRHAFQIETDLETIYRQNPGLRTNTADPELFRKEANRILHSPRRVDALMKFVTGDRKEFQAARSEIIDKLVRTEPSRGRVVISGQSVTGMIAAAIAAQSGYQVEGLDLRKGFTRNIQWANRQAMVDELASIDPNLARKFLLLVTDMTGGYVLATPQGRTGADHPLSHTPGDPRNIPRTGADVLARKPAGIVETKAFEELLLEYVSHHPNIHRRQGTVTVGERDPATGKYTVTLNEPGPDGKTLVPKETFQPDLFIVAEGANSKTRDALGIKTVPTSHTRMEVAGILEFPGQTGQLVRRYRQGSTGKLVTITMGAEGAKGVWVITDLDPAKITATDPVERQKQIEHEFRVIAADNLGIPFDAVKSAKITGAFGDTQIKPFDLTQRISTEGAAGSNALLLADAVGNAHWSAGGGATVGSVSHAERLKNYFTEIGRGVDPQTAIDHYSRGVLEDTDGWGAVSLFDFYDHMTQAEGKQAYRLAMDAYRRGLVETPLRALEIMFPKGRETTNVAEQLETAPKRLRAAKVRKKRCGFENLELESAI